MKRKMLQADWRHLILSLLAVFCMGGSQVKAADLDVTNQACIYQIFCSFSPNGSTWYPDNASGAEVQVVDNKLRLKNICGISDWIEGEIVPGENKAIFQTGEIEEGSYFNAYYIEDNQEIYLDEIYFEFTPDYNTITLSDHEGFNVIIGQKYASGYWSVRWKSVALYLFPDTPSTPPADCNSYFMNMTFQDQYDNNQSKILEIYEKDDEVWFKDFVYEDVYLYGKVLSNGNISFNVPQFQGIVANYLSYAYARKNGVAEYEFQLILQPDGTYELESGMEIWRGELEPEYKYISNAVFSPVSSYEGAPMPPTNVVWNGNYDHFVDFYLPMQGTNGEELNREWTYWQVLINNEPYQFTYQVYNDFNILILGDPYYIDVNMSFFYMDQTTWNFIDWGNLGDGNFRVYLPEFTSEDNISIRCGYQRPGGEMYWSDAVIAEEGEIVIVPFPDEALYSTSVTYDTEWGGYSESGLAMYAKFADEQVEISGFFGHDGWVNGAFIDSRMQKAQFISPQKIGTTDDKEVFLYAATLSDSSMGGQMQFIKENQFILNVGSGGEIITVDDRDIYFLEVIDDEITNVWYSDLRMEIVDEQITEIPADATVTEYEMSYRNIWEERVTDTIQIYQGDTNEIWIDGMIRYDDETAVLVGSMENGIITIEFPQFVGVLRGQIAYATCNPWDFYPGELIFEEQEDGSYYCNGDVWIGPSTLSWPMWRSVTDITLTPCQTSSIGKVSEDSEISIVNDSFVSSLNEEVEVYSLSGIRIPNSNLKPSIYIVRAGKKAWKYNLK